MAQCSPLSLDIGVRRGDKRTRDTLQAGAKIIVEQCMHMLDCLVRLVEEVVEVRQQEVGLVADVHDGGCGAVGAERGVGRVGEELRWALG